MAESYANAELSSGTFIPSLNNRGSVHNFSSPSEHPSISGTLLLRSLLSEIKNTWVQRPIIMVRFPANTREFYLFEIAHICSRSHPAYSAYSGELSRVKSACGVSVTTNLQLVSRFRMSRTIPPRPLSSWRHRNFTFAILTTYNNDTEDVLISEVPATLLTATLWPEIVYSNKF